MSRDHSGENRSLLLVSVQVQNLVPKVKSPKDTVILHNKEGGKKAQQTYQKEARACHFVRESQNDKRY